MHHIPVLLFLSPFKRTPWVINFHGSDLKGTTENKLLKSLAGSVLNKSDLLVVPTDEFKQMITDHFPAIPKEKMVISPSGGIDESRFFALDHNRDAKELVLGFVSRITAEKGWKTFLDALVIMKKEQIQFKAIIGGKGPDEQLMRREIENNGLGEHIHFKGFIPQENLYKVYNEMDIYVFPTYRDSLGLTGLEAMSCGVPVIASRIQGGPTSYVIDGVNGYLFEPGNSADLYNKIRKFHILLQEDKKQMSLEALATAKDYQRSHVARVLIGRLEKLLAK